MTALMSLRGNRKERLIKISSTLLLLSIMFLVYGCTDGGSGNGTYYQTFEKIRTNQFTRSYGRGGIYWVSDNAVVLDGAVENESGALVHGVYLVTMEGVYNRLVEVLDYPGWFYCYSEKVLYVRNISGRFNVFDGSREFEVKAESIAKRTLDNKYSRIRCQMVTKPTKDDYRPLREKDGQLKIYLDNFNKKARPSKNNSSSRNVELTDDKGGVKQVLGLKVGDISSSPYFLRDRNAYFGFSKRQNCVSLWWLYTDDWRSRTDKRCFDSWANNGSINVVSTRVGLFVSNHSSRGYKTYLFSGDKEFALENISARQSSLSPDGCRVAYAHGNYRARNGVDDYRQVLKIFDACKFIKEQGRRDDNTD